MLLFDLFSRASLSRFGREMREQGMRSAVKKTWMYVTRRLSGRGITGIEVGGSYTARPPAQYMTPVWLELADKGGFHITKAPAFLKQRRKVAMIGDLNLPQCRKYRVEQLYEIWCLADVDYSYSHYEDVARSIAILQDASHVMFYRLGTSPITSMLAYEARRLRLPVLYDLDDPLFSVSAYGTYENMKALPDWQKAHFVNEAPKYLDVLNSADLVSVSTPGMQAHTSLYTARPVHVRRNFADRIALEAGAAAMRTSRRNGADFRVAFVSGSQGHEVDFALIAEDITTFLANGARRKLVILGYFDKALLPEALREQVETHAFSDYTTYLDTLASVDCAVMPLTDDPFNRCKSAVRVIDAASVGVPGLVGTVSDMATMIEDGRTGRVLSPGASWAAALEEMAQDVSATRDMGHLARKALEETWSARLEAPVIDPEMVAWVTQ